ncbi:hypothetical protein TNCV_3366881 [Trichonephila clavipes]|nr:hypothetical protein TNCV_3366881 [Trichonephila clavipes]
MSTFGDSVANELTARHWFKKFKSGDLSLCDKARTGRPHALDDKALQTAIEEDSIVQGWRTIGTRTIHGTQHNILGTPAIKIVCILFQNNKVHYEVLRTNASDRSWGSGERTRLLLSCLSYVVDCNC